jgi:hypothetical protein
MSPMSIVRRAILVHLALVSSACSGGAHDEATSPAPSVAKRVEHGSVRRWPEATTFLSVDVDVVPPSTLFGPAHPSGLVAFWSIATTAEGGSGFFYADTFRATPETELALASGVRRVGEIHDAAAFDYAHASIGPVRPGEIVLIHHRPSARYLALVLDAIEPAEVTAGPGPYAYADVTWYLTAAGDADFSGAAR